MSQEVQFGRSFKKFLFYLVLSAVVGFSGRYFINNLMQQAWEPIRVEMEQKGIIATSPRLILSRYGFPVFGGVIDSVEITETWNCFSIDGALKSIYVPVPWKMFFSKSWKLSHVYVGSLELVGQETVADCKTASQAPESTVGKDVLVKSSQLIKGPKWERHVKRWFDSHSRWQAKNMVESVDFDEIKVRLSNLEDKHVDAIGKGGVEFKDDLTLHLYFDSLELKKKNKKIMSEFEVSIEANSEQLKASSKWGFNEGGLVLVADAAKNGKTSVRIESNNLPLSVLNRWVDTPWSFQFLWLNCHLSSSAETRLAWAKSNWLTEGCQIKSPHGEIRMLNTSLSSLVRTQNLSLEVNNLELDKIIKNKQYFPLAKLFKNFGALTGEINLVKKMWTGTLSLSESSLLFSRNNLRRLQPISKIQIGGSYGRGKYKVELKDLVLGGGDFKGEVSLDYDVRASAGGGDVKIQSLVFAPEIQDLMISGVMSPLEVSGSYDLGEDFDLTNWSGLIAFASYEAKEVIAERAQIESHWTPEKGVRVKASLRSLKVAGNKSLPWLYASLLEESHEPLVLTRVVGKASLKDRKLVWKDLTGRSSTNLFWSKGSYDKSHDFSGELKWKRAKDSLLWSFKSMDKKFVWIPQNKPMIDWIKAHEDFAKAYPFLEIDPAELE